MDHARAGDPSPADVGRSRLGSRLDGVAPDGLAVASLDHCCALFYKRLLTGSFESDDFESDDFGKKIGSTGFFMAPRAGFKAAL